MFQPPWRNALILRWYLRRLRKTGRTPTFPIPIPPAPPEPPPEPPPIPVPPPEPPPFPPPPPPPGGPVTATFVVQPTSFGPGGGTVTLTWTSQNATSVQLGSIFGPTDVLPLNGSTQRVVTASTIFILFVSGPGGSLQLDRVVAVGAAPPPPPPPPPSDRRLVGTLGVSNKIFVDAAGPRRVLFCSWFPALRILRDSPAVFAQQLDAMKAHGWQGFRTFAAVGGFVEFWRGREVVPINFINSEGELVVGWPDYFPLWRTMLRACRARGLRLHVTTGDCQFMFDGNPEGEVEFHRELARVSAEEGGPEVIAVWEAHNEYFQNSIFGDSAAEDVQDQKIRDAVKQYLPNVLYMRGAAPASDTLSGLEKGAIASDIVAVHGRRQPPVPAIESVFNLFFMGGNIRAFRLAIWQGEPTGPDGAEEVVFQPQNDPAWLLGLYGMIALTAQGCVFLSGPGIIAREPLEATWGFAELPGLMTHIPEDIGTWGGAMAPGSIYYWSKGDQFLTLAVEGFPTTPPRPIATWTVIDWTGNQTSGSGPLPPAPPGFKALLIKGTFA